MKKSLQLLIYLTIFCINIESIYSLDNLYTSNNNNVYYLENEKKYSWYDALAKCVSMDMTLATIDTKEKSDEITELLRKTFGNVNPAWIGGVATSNDRKFVWITTGADVTFTNWSPGEPSFSKNNEYCLLTGWLNNLQWNDGECHSHHGLICEYSEHSHTQNEMRSQLQEELTKDKHDNNQLLKLLLGSRNSDRKNDKGNIILNILNIN